MPRTRRLSTAPQVDLMPLIDVVFLLLTFFIFALVLTVRVRVTEINLPDVASGPEGQPQAAVVVALNEAGGLTLRGEPVAFGELGERLDALRAADPNVRLLIAVDQEARVGDQFRLIDALRDAGETDLSFLRQPTGGG